MNGEQLVACMEKGERIYGTMMSSTVPTWFSAISTVGLDFVFIDTEHMPLDRGMLSFLCHNYNALGIAPLVRIPSPDPFEACKALDAGACGILAPYIETPEQVRQLIGAVKYRPLKGNRLQRVLSGDAVLSKKESDYFKSHNSGRFLLVNIESSEAINNLDSILEIPELSGVVIGPHDLSINLGVPEEYTCKIFTEAVSLIIRKALEYKKSVGNHFSFGIEQEIGWAKEGMNIILHSIDYIAFMNTMRDELNFIRKSLGEPLFAGAAALSAE